MEHDSNSQDSINQDALNVENSTLPQDSATDNVESMPLTIDEIAKQVTQEAQAQDSTKQAPKDATSTPLLLNPPPPKELKPLDFWSKQDKDFFLSMQPDQQEKLLNMYKNTQRIFERKTLEVAKQGKEYQMYDEILRPYEEALAQQKISKSDYINGLISADIAAASSPVDFIVSFMNSKNISPETLADALDKDIKIKSDPAYSYVAPLQQQVQNLTQQNQQFQMRLQQEDRQKQQEYSNALFAEQNARLDDFANTQDEAGNLKHPFFNAVIEQMTEISKSTGETDLDKLYEEAVWRNPQVRSTVVDLERKKALSQAQSQLHAAKARVASTYKYGNNARIENPRADEVSLDSIIGEEVNRLNLK